MPEPKSRSRKHPLKKKKEKGTLMMFPMAQKTPHPAYLHSPSRNPGPGSVP